MEGPSIKEADHSAGLAGPECQVPARRDHLEAVPEAGALEACEVVRATFDLAVVPLTDPEVHLAAREVLRVPNRVVGRPLRQELLMAAWVTTLMEDTTTTTAT